MKITREEAPEHFDIVAIDCDLLAYRSAFAAEKNIWYLRYDGEVTEFESKKAAQIYIQDQELFFNNTITDYVLEAEKVYLEKEVAFRACDSLLEDIYRNVPSDMYRLYLDGGKNYRKEISVTKVYKGNRTQPKPKWLKAVRQYLQDKHGAVVVQEALEGDDLIGVVMSLSHYKPEYKTCGVTIDKDNMNCMGYMYNFVKNEWYWMDEDEANRNFFTQSLTGDKVDNISGLVDVSTEFREKHALRKSKGVGKVTAEKLISDCKTPQEMYDRVKEAYQSYHGDNWRVMLNEMGKLVWIMRRKNEIFDCSWYE